MKFGYTFIWVEDVEGTVGFYEQAFGLERSFVTDNGELGLYAEMETGETKLAITDIREARVLFPGGFYENDPSLPPSAFQLSFVTEDVEATYERALGAGATGIAEPSAQPWGQTIARVRDPNGVLVSIASPLQAQAS